MFYWLYSVLYIFLTIIISSLIIEQNLKLIFFLIMFLLYISVYNIFITFEYYIKLRNNPGIKGDRGDPGEPGQDGNNGVCVMAKNCSIANCRNLVIRELEKQLNEVFHTVINSREDAMPCFRIASWEVRRYQQQLYLCQSKHMRN